MEQSSLFHNTAAKQINLQHERWKSIEQPCTLDITNIDRAVVFILAVWSGPAVAMLRTYSTVLSSLDPTDVPLIVVDIDSIREISSNGFPPSVTHGIGETYFIKEGLIAERIETLVREDKKTVSNIPPPIDFSACAQRFSNIYARVFRVG